MFQLNLRHKTSRAKVFWFFFSKKNTSSFLCHPNVGAMRHALSFVPALLAAACATAPPKCAPPGSWVAPASLRSVPDPVPAARDVVLLGEQHDRDADHRWQLATIERLYAANPALVLGFEMFPRADQPVLDRWVGGHLSEADFLSQTDWKHVWGFPAGLYMPIFRFARDHHIPMVALNVSHGLVHRVAQEGWDKVPVAAREGVGTPAAPSAAYQASLKEAMSGHAMSGQEGPAMTPARLQHFIEAQSVWDRAMAEAIVAQRPRQVVAIMGAGHLQGRNGVPHQLEALGVANTIVFLPEHDLCAPPGPGYADAVYID
jgi:uncharacterized iron-regulated protein